MHKEKVVLAYSGGLDTSIMIPWLKEHYDCDVVAMCADLGQGKEIDGLKDKAIQTGACSVYIEDLRDIFIRDYIFPTMQAGAIYEGKYLLGTSFGRPLIAKRQVEIARKEKASMVAHGATGKGNDQVRFELAFMALAPDLKIIAPWKDEKWDLHSREACIDYADQHQIPIVQSKKRIYSEDANIWHISHEGGELEDPMIQAGEGVFSYSSPLKKASDQGEDVTIGFESGIPISINDDLMMPVDLLTRLNEIGAKHAIGQVDMVENRLVGMKSRGVYETPGGTLLYAAHQYLESLVLDRDTMHYKQKLGLEYADLVYDGRWFCPLREAMDAFVQSTQKKVTGVVTLHCYKGNIVPVGYASDYSLYDSELASFSDSALYDQKDATGFIRLYGLPMKVQGMVDRK